MRRDALQRIRRRMRAHPKSSIPKESWGEMVRRARLQAGNVRINDPQIQLAPGTVNYILQSLNDIHSMAEAMQQDIGEIKEDIRLLRRQLDNKWNEGFGEPEEIVEMPIDEIKKLILTKLDRDKPFYPSDIAMDHNLDYDAVIEAVDELIHEGHLQAP